MTSQQHPHHELITLDQNMITGTDHDMSGPNRWLPAIGEPEISFQSSKRK
ncbi:hypothetical protein [Algicola sagamiensis]|nr:hypothetical protein [Algicola sagamiensis]